MAAKAGITKLHPVPKGEPEPEKPPVDDNVRAMTEQEEREASFLRHMAALRRQRDIVDEAKGALKAVKKIETRMRNEAKADGWMLKLIDEIMDDESKSRVDLAAENKARNFMREIVGLPIGGQADLFERMPEEARDAETWGADGYRAGARGLPAKPPTEMPARFMQDWMKRWTAGKERLDWAQAEQGINPERTRTDIASGPVELEPVDDDEDEGDDIL